MLSDGSWTGLEGNISGDIHGPLNHQWKLGEYGSTRGDVKQLEVWRASVNGVSGHLGIFD